MFIVYIEDERPAVSIVDGARSDIWLLGSGVPTPITSDGRSLAPRWTPDGRRIAYTKLDDKRTLHWKPALGIGGDSLLLDRPGIQFPIDFTPDGQTLIFFEDHPVTRGDIWQLSVRTGDLAAIATSSADEAQPALSPDGSWLAYTSDQSGGVRNLGKALSRRDGLATDG